MDMLPRSLAFAALLCAGASLAAADDPDNAPCTSIADDLRDYAGAHPDAVDTGGFEFLNGAAHIGYDRNFVPSEQAPVSALATQSFSTRAEAVAAITGVTDPGDARAFLEDDWLDDTTSTYLRDLRPHSPHVILSQTQGTMHCDIATIFRVEGATLVKTSHDPEQDGSVCWTQSLTAIRVGGNAYPAIQEISSGPSDLDYSVMLLPPEGGAIEEQDAFCRVRIAFRPTRHIESWYPSKNADSALLTRLREVLEPMLVADTDDAWAAQVKALRPTPTGNDLYDILLRAADGSNLLDLLHSMDPTSQMAEIPNAEPGSYTSWGGSGVIPDPDLIEIDHHRLLLFTGQPTFGWRTYPDLGFAVWEWDGVKVVPIVGGYLGKQGTGPQITVE